MDTDMQNMMVAGRRLKADCHCINDLQIADDSGGSVSVAFLIFSQRDIVAEMTRQEIYDDV